MSRQDRQGVRRPADLEQKYKFGNAFSDLEKTTIEQGEQIKRQNQAIVSYMASTDETVQEMFEETETMRHAVDSLKKDGQELQRSFFDLSQSVETLSSSTIPTINKDLEHLGEQIAAVNEDIADVETEITEAENRAKAYADEVASGGSNAGVLETVYPIGAVYISTVSTNPATLFGFGTWEQIQDRFLLAAGSTYAAGSTGGEADHTLTVDEMPSHRHRQVFDFGNGSVRPAADTTQSTSFTDTEAVTNGNYKISNATVAFGTASTSNPAYPLVTLETGGGAAHNNMPPYLTVYVWKRTA